MRGMNLSARVLSFVLCSVPLLRAKTPAASELSTLAAAALAGDSTAIQKLRTAGPPGLEALFEAGKDGITALRQNESRLEAPENAQLRAALDGVARQRDAFASGLYWFTDLDAAKAEAKKTKRPILSLRLLGNLDDEFSCANSRFFRTSLYANRTVSALLRRGYVLHWKSVRPVPVLTIDMGDGRRIKRTITGNSIHYILDADGHVLDALPGNYGPASFIAALVGIEKGTSGSGPPQINRWHARQAISLCDGWLYDAVLAGVYGEKAASALQAPKEQAKLLEELHGKAFPESSGRKADKEAVQSNKVAAARPESLSPEASRFGEAVFLAITAEAMFDDFEPGVPLDGSGKPQPKQKETALLASVPIVDRLFRSPSEPKITVIQPFPYPTEFDPPKAMVERPLMQKAPAPTAEQALDPASIGSASSAPLAHHMNTQWWAKIAARHRYVVELDDNSRRLMMAKLPETMLHAEEIKTGAPVKDSPFARMLENFESAIARDMVRNEYYFHTLIHQWLEEDKDGTLTRDVEALNKRVYAELFLTPDYDEWLGLVPEDTYTALEKDGCACDKNAPPMRTTKVAR